MMDPTALDVIEATLVADLQTALPAIPVEAYPDNPDRYDFIHEVGACLVRYEGGRFSDPFTMDDLDDLAFNITLLARSLRGHEGAYTFLSAIRGVAHGKQFIAPLPFRCAVKREGYVNVHGGIWRFDINLAVGVDEADIPEPGMLKDLYVGIAPNIGADHETDYFQVVEGV